MYILVFKLLYAWWLIFFHFHYAQINAMDFHYAHVYVIAYIYIHIYILRI